MRKLLFILIFLPLVFGLSSGQQTAGKKPIDSVPASVQDQAKIRTDQMIDSIYSTYPLQWDAVVTGFRELRDQIDTMYIRLILAQQDIEAAAIERDKAIQNSVLIIEQYIAMKQQKEEATRLAQFAANWPTWCMLLLVVVGGSYFGSGVATGLQKSKSQKKDEK